MSQYNSFDIEGETSDEVLVYMSRDEDREFFVVVQAWHSDEENFLYLQREEIDFNSYDMAQNYVDDFSFDSALKFVKSFNF